MHRSRSASSSSVRCGCQYFQSNDPLPEKKSLIGTPPQSRTPTMADHEYEPITPKEPPPPAVLKVSEFSEVEKRPATPVPQQRFERRYIKIPNEDAIIIPLHGDSDEDINPDRYVDKELTVQEFQDRMEERFFTTSPTTTDPNVNGGGGDVSQNLATQKGSQNFQTTLRNQAGRFRNQLRKISTPKISLPERSKIKFPERPKIKLPNRPKIKLPDRPKIKLPDRPKFLQEKPKFFTERPKFLTERPKFLTERPKFLSERPKFHLPERPKFHLPERFKTDKSKSKGPRPKKPNPSSLRRPLRDVVTVSSQSGSGNNIFETLKFKTYPRFLSRKKKERERAQLSAQGTSFETESSLPSTPPSRQKFNPPWVETYRDIKFADDDPATTSEQNKDIRIEVQDEEGYDENTAPFHDSYMPEVVNMQEEEPTKAKPESEGSVNDSDKEIHSSGSSSMRHRAGVLEEIDSDEFFLREKGLSREDVDVSRYLSIEIRDAFRSPKNALAKLDAELYDDEYDEEEPEIRFDEIPKAPERRKPSKSPATSRATKESDFNTFPSRPIRRKQSDPMDFGGKEVFEKIEKPPRKYRSKSDTRQSSMPSLRRSTSQGMTVDVEPPLPPKRRKGSRSLSRSIHDSATDFDAADIVHREITVHERDEVPVAPFRKSRSRGTSLAEEDRTSRGADSTDLPHDDMELREKEIVHESIFQAKPTFVEESQVTGYAVVMKTKKDKGKPPPRPPPPPTRLKKHKFQSHLHNIRDQSMHFFFTYPRRAIKSLHKPPIRPIRNYSTLGPSRPPRRNRVFREPVYVDSEEPNENEILIIGDDGIGVKEDFEVKDLQSGEVVEKMKGRPLPPPPRPPRRSKDDDDILIRSSRVEEYLTSGEPLSEETLVEEEKQTSLEQTTEEFKSDLKEKHSFIKTKGEEILNSLSKMYPFNSERRKSEIKKEDKSIAQMKTETSQQTSFEITEVSVSIQTDPLPEGYVVEDAHSELEAETTSQRSQSTIADQTRLDQRQVERQFVERDLERQGISTPLREVQGRLTSRDEMELAASLLPSRDLSQSYVSRDESPPPLPERGVTPIFPSSIPVVPVFPDKLHISELDVDRLNVTELQASKVSTQEVESTTLNVSQLNSKGGNLVVNGIELPPDFIETLTAQIKERLPQLPTTPQPQLRRVMTPSPSIFVQHLEDEVEKPVAHISESTDKIPKPRTTKSKGRRSPTRVIDDSEDELASILPVRERRERESSVKREEISRRSADIQPPADMPLTGDTSQQATSIDDIPVITPTAVQLIAQLLVIWHRNVLEGASTFMEGFNSLFPEGEKRRDAQTAACILLVLVAGLILIGFGIDNSVHHHHWDYVPPR